MSKVMKVWEDEYEGWRMWRRVEVKRVKVNVVSECRKLCNLGRVRVKDIECGEGEGRGG